MAAKRKTRKDSARSRNLYLYLTIAFFLAIIAIFIFDGYMGVYDTVTVTAQEQEETIEPEYWLRDDYSSYTWVEEGQDIYFHYQLDNRTFGSYSADIEVAIWFGETKQEVLLTQAVAIASFDKAELEWTVDTAGLRPGDIAANQDYGFSVIITRDGVELRTVVQVAAIPKYEVVY